LRVVPYRTGRNINVDPSRLVVVPRHYTTLEVTRKGNKLNIDLPLPNKQKCTFPLYPEETVNDFIIDIRDEDRENSNIHIKDTNGITISNSTLIRDLIKSPFVIDIEKEGEFPVFPQLGAVGQVVGNVEISDLIDKTIFKAVRERLFSDHNRHHTTYDDYIKLCDSYGISATQADEYLDALNTSGLVYHFKDNQYLRDYVFLKPTDISASLSTTLKLKYTTKSVANLRAELASLQAKFAPLHLRKQTLDTKAKHRSKLFLRGGLLYLAVQSSILAHMVWIDYSWGTMEPVTYFVFLSTLIGGLYFYLLERDEFTYVALERRQFMIALKRLYLAKSEPFNWKEWNEMRLKIVGLKEAVGEEVERDLKGTGLEL